jgi:GWxTD domain-containing protein
MKTKLLALIIVGMIGYNLLATETLGMFVDMKRYLDVNHNTRFEIDYQVPYKNLIFLTRQKVFYAELKVTISISNSDSVVYKKDFVNNIGVSSKYDVVSSSKSYLDRISMTLAKPGLHIDVLFEDLNGLKSYKWASDFALLQREFRLSDVDFLSQIRSDSLAVYSKYKKQQHYYIPNPSGLVARETNDSVFFYLETYPGSGNASTVLLSIFKDDQLLQKRSLTQASIAYSNPFTFGVNIRDLVIGKYKAVIEAINGDLSEQREVEFIITEQLENFIFLFSEPDDDYQLLRYLVNVKSQSAWQDLSKEAKRRYLTQVWEGVASQLKLSVEDVKKRYRERIDYCNRYYSHFEPGWRTDRGRIYIRNGAPDDLEKGTTPEDAKYVGKDYQVWKYTSKLAPIYIFVDMQMNGSYKLIYAKNDEGESTYPDWENYLGADFDVDQMEKPDWEDD